MNKEYPIIIKKIFRSDALTLQPESYEDAYGNLLSVLLRKLEHEEGEDYYEATAAMIR